jgi:alkaline phosphatase D
MSARRRQLLTLAAAGALGPIAPAFVRHARAADVPRFAMGIASGQPHATGMVLWTRLSGDELPAQVDVAWELAEDEAFSRIAARGNEKAVDIDAHCVHAEPAGLEPARWYWYRFSALGQRSAVGRTRTAPAAGAAVARLEFAIASCQRYDVGHYAAWRHAAAEPLDLVMFLGDYIYEYASANNPVRRVDGGKVRALSDYRQRYAQYKGDPALQAAHAACPWLLVWDDHEVDNDYAGLQGQDLQFNFAAQRAAAYQAYWEHMPLPKAARPVDGAMRMFGSLDWGTLARIHLLDDRQYRDVQVCPRPGKGGSNTVKLADCAALNDPRRTLLGAGQERWLAGNWSLERPWNLLAQQTLMARFSWQDPQDGGMFWTDGWDGYAPARQRLLGVVAERKVPGVVVLGGDVHGNYVADLRPDYDDPKSPVVASEFCGTSITSLSLPQDRVDAARRFNPHIRYARSDERGYMRFSLDAKRLQASLRVVDDARDPASGIRTAARFTVDAERPGAATG